MKKTLFLGLLAGFLFDLYATDARVIALGGDNLFYIDEVSIFQNPANIGLYPDLLYGSLGVYRSFGTDSSTSRYHEPSDPFFGGIASLPFTPDTINGNKHSAFFLGGFFNRHDAMLDYLDPHSGRYVGNTGDVMIRPSGAVDLLLGYSWQNGTMIGIGGYAASGSSTVGPVIDSETSLYKLNAGIRAPFGDNGAVEWSAGTGLMRGKGDSAGAGLGPIIVADNDGFYRSDLRIFIPLHNTATTIVPQAHYSNISLYHGEVSLAGFSGGVGINVPLTRGLFWAGLQYLFQENGYFHDSTSTSNGGKVSFGIEHYIIGDWLIARAGGEKVLAYTSTTYAGRASAKGTVSDNLPQSGTDSDLLGLGLGFVIKARLRIDVVVSDNLPYTLGIVTGGSEPYLLSRVSATYRF